MLRELNSTCPLCHGNGAGLFEAKGYVINSCRKCSHRWAKIGDVSHHVSIVYGDEYFFDGGAGYPDYTLGRRHLIEQGVRYNKIFKRHVKKGHLLDVGCAAGFFLKAFSDAGWAVTGVEPNTTMARYGQEQLGLDIRNTSFEDFHDRNEYDAVTMIQVLPHFVDPRSAIKKASDYLRVDGLLLIEFWDRASLTARIFGKKWHEYSPPSVLHWFSIKGLKTLVGQFDFRIVSTGRPLKKISGLHAKSLLLHQLGDTHLNRGFKRVVAKIPDSAKLSYRAGDAKWIMLRKSPNLAP